jgi:hypothetical protein
MGMISGGSLLSTLGTLSGYASAAMPVIQAVSTIKNVVDGFGNSGDDDARAQLRSQQDLAMQQLRAQQGLAEMTAVEQAALDRQNIAANAQNAEAARRTALRRATARQRATFGAQGLSANDGSGEAVLLGLFDESDADRQSRERLDTLRNQAIDQNLDQQQRINVLQRTQLQERQSLDRALSGF